MMKSLIGSIITIIIVIMLIFAFVPSMNMVANNMDVICTAPAARIGDIYTNEKIPDFLEFKKENYHVYIFSIMGYGLRINLNDIYDKFESLVNGVGF